MAAQSRLYKNTLGGGFGAEDALETRAGELHPNKFSPRDSESATWTTRP